MWRRRLVCLAVQLAVLVIGIAGVARGAGADTADRDALARDAASSDPVVASGALYRLAELDEESGAYASALARYRAALATLPSMQRAPRAAARASLLEAHSEGAFGPFARLERVRRDPAASRDAAVIDALARDADAFPPGLVRVEARMLAADAYLHRLGRPADGRAALRLVIDDPLTDPLTRRQAEAALVDALASSGDLAGARRAVDAAGSAGDPKLRAHVVTLARRRTLHRAAWIDLAVVALLASASLARAAATRRGALADVARHLRRLAPLAIAFTAYVAIAGGALAAKYESGNALPFWALGAVLLVLVALARAWSATGGASRTARVTRAVLAATTVVAAAFLVLESIDTMYLEGFGL